jgi:hypothetical protein
MDVVDLISRVPVSSRGPHEAMPNTPVLIKSVRLIEP